MEGFYPYRNQSEVANEPPVRMKEESLTHLMRSSRVMPQVVGISSQGIDPSLSHHQVQCGVVFGSYGKRGLSSRLSLYLDGKALESPVKTRTAKTALPAMVRDIHRAL
jgi:hypothetical protein